MIHGLQALFMPFLGFFFRLVGKEIEKKIDKPKKKAKPKKPKPPPKPSKTLDEVLAESRERTKDNKPDVGPPGELDDNPYGDEGDDQ